MEEVNENVSEEVVESPEVENPEKEVSTEEKQEKTPLENLKEQAKLGEANSERVETTKAVQPAPFTPNLKFRVHDKEHEIEEWAKPLITDKEKEGKFRELYEKAYGLEVIKPKLQSTREELTGIKAGLDECRGDVSRNDFDSFFKKVNIDPNKVFQWAVKKAQYENLPPEQKMAYDDYNRLQNEKLTAERTASSLQNQYQEAIVQQKNTELDYFLQRPEINSVMKDFDASRGKVGAFREELALLAHAKELATGQPVTVEQAVTNILALMGKNQGSQPSVNPQGINANPNKVVQKPVIPNIRSSGVSPVKKQARSIAELRELSKQFNAE